MATTLTVQQIGPTGLVPTYVAADVTGNNFVNGGDVVLNFINASAAPITLTVATRACDQGVIHNKTFTIPITVGGNAFQAGPFPTTRYNDPTGKVNITYSGVTSLTVAAIEDIG